MSSGYGGGGMVPQMQNMMGPQMGFQGMMPPGMMPPGMMGPQMGFQGMMGPQGMPGMMGMMPPGMEPNRPAYGGQPQDMAAMQQQMNQALQGMPRPPQNMMTPGVQGGPALQGPIGFEQAQRMRQQQNPFGAGRAPGIGSGEWMMPPPGVKLPRLF